MPQSQANRKRVRLHSTESEVTRDGRCLARVWVEWLEGTLYEGSGEGTDTQEGRVRSGADAALEAAGRVTGGRLRLTLRGIKVVRAFDALVVIVSMRGVSAGKQYELLGSTAAPDDDLVLGGTMAVLDATNRILEKYAERPEGASAS